MIWEQHPEQDRYKREVFNCTLILRLLMDHAFKNVEFVVFQIGSTNIRSQKAILKIGAKKIREMDFDLNGKKLVVYESEIKRRDWKNS